MKVSSPQYEILKSTKQINLFLSGVGSGKSHVGGIIAYNFVSKYPQIFGFIGANTYDQLNTSTLYRIREVWKELGIHEYSKENPKGVYVNGIKPPPHFYTKNHSFDNYSSIISFSNGSIIFKGSLENAKSHDGKQFGFAILDETKDTRESDVRDVILARLRQPGIFIKDGQLSHDGEPFNPCYILTSPAKVKWLNDMFELENHINEIQQRIYSDNDYFVSEFGNKKVVISSTYHNLHNLPANYIDNFKQNNTEERVKALIYANPFSASGGEFYSSFSRLKHVKDQQYRPNLPIHASFDQNTVPYNSCVVFQIEKVDEIWHIYAIDEICLKNPKNSTEEVCEELLRLYGDCNGIYFYGDASGKNRSTLSKAEKHHYQVIERMLLKKLVVGSNRVLKSNPLLERRRDFINKIFEEKTPIRICVSHKCVNLLSDLTYLKQDIDGGKKKEVTKNAETGERYEKYGHTSDCMDYFITSAFKTFFV
jgi:hypothetical protein